jgi:hypothetical protein
MSNPSDILNDQTVPGSVLVEQRGGGAGTLFSDRADNGTIQSDHVIGQRRALPAFNARVRGKHAPVPGVACSCPMATKERGNDSAYCIVCGGEA